MLTLSRPELLQRRPTWGAGQRSFTALHLEPLPREAMAALLRGFVAGLPDTVVEHVLQRAEGVPLYAVETIRMLVDRGQLVERDGLLTVTGTLGSLDIPDTLHALIASRLDGVPPEERSLLQNAAVIGQTFSVPALAALSGGDAAALAASLRDLVLRELLALDTDPRSPERGQYGFVQGLIREVAYGTLAKPERRAKHVAAAEYFEGLDDDELVGVVATHYAEAQRATSERTERDLTGARAREWLARAGRRALALGSPEQALAYLEQALALTDDLAARAALLDVMGDAAFRAEAFERSVASLEAAITLYQGVANLEAAGQSTARLADVLGLALRRFADAITRAEEAIAWFGETGSERTRADLAATLAAMQTDSERRRQPSPGLRWRPGRTPRRFRTVGGTGGASGGAVPSRAPSGGRDARPGKDCAHGGCEFARRGSMARSTHRSTSSTTTPTRRSACNLKSPSWLAAPGYAASRS